MPWQVWAHLLTIMPAMALTPVMLTRPRGDTRHRVLGYVWVSLLAAQCAAPRSTAATRRASIASVIQPSRRSVLAAGRIGRVAMAGMVTEVGRVVDVA